MGVDFQNRVLSPDGLLAWRRSLGPDARVAVITGTFDILQPGNLAGLRRACASAPHVCVILEPDAAVALHARPGRPQNGLGVRAEMVSLMRGVSAVTGLKPERAAGFFAQFQPYVWCVARSQRRTDPFGPALSQASAVVEVEPVPGGFTADIHRAIERRETPVHLPDRLYPVAVAAAPEKWRKRLGGQASRTMVSVNGCFDILHLGHLRFLAEARALGSELVVLVNDDASVARYKGPDRPVFPLGFRMAALLALESVDAVIPFPGDDPLDVLARLRPDIHVKGGSFEPARVSQERELVGRWGGRLVCTPLVAGYSTTEFIRKALETVA
jgi:rfaE bifunctional protein nucleotidyltransferase chain/domain